MRTCPCRQTSPIFMHRDADMSPTGREGMFNVEIDKCLVPIVKALQRAGINMRHVRCNEGRYPGLIQLADGRDLIIKERAGAELQPGE